MGPTQLIFAAVSLLACGINAQSATTAAPQLTSSVVTLYIDESFETKFGLQASVISANAQTTAYVFPPVTSPGNSQSFTVGYTYTEINGPAQTWIYTSTEGAPIFIGLEATCSTLPANLVYCTAGTYQDDPAQAKSFSYTTPFDTAFLYPVTITAGLEKLPQPSSTPTSAPTTTTTTTASPGGTSTSTGPAVTSSPGGGSAGGSTLSTHSSSVSTGKTSSVSSTSAAYTGPTKVGTSDAGVMRSQSTWILLMVAFIAAKIII